MILGSLPQIVLQFLLFSDFRTSGHRPPSITTTSLQSSTRNLANEKMDLSFPKEWLEEDHYNGITVHLEQMATDNENYPGRFAAMLQNSLAAWRQEGRRAVWLFLPHEHADLVGTAVKSGFAFHMVSPNGQTLVLKQWLPLPDDKDETSRLPAGPTHQVGVGCLVLHPHDSSQMLVVREKTGPAAAYGLWKMPTGLADAGEDVHDAALRELREETGLTDVAFRGLVAMRQAHPAPVEPGQRLRRAVSDLFCVCLLEVDKDSNYETFDLCPEEIEAVQWMPVQEYCDQERWQNSPVYLELNRAILAASASPKGVFQAQTLEVGFGRGMNTVYHGQIDDETSASKL